MPRHDFATHSQALSLYASGKKAAAIEQETSIKKLTFYYLLKKAKQHGFRPGQPIIKAMVEDRPRAGRPKKPAEVVELVI